LRGVYYRRLLERKHVEKTHRGRKKYAGGGMKKERHRRIKKIEKK
jgi:hypothetical protein